jgi:hypothetical protein
MGIALLASPVLRTRTRDEWIGWTPEAFVQQIQTGRWPAKKAIRALAEKIDAQIATIRFDDLATPEEIEAPNERVCSASALMGRIGVIEQRRVSGSS